MSEPDLTPIGSELRARKERRKSNITAWMAGQGAKIREERGEFVYAACMQMAMGLIGRQSWRYLSRDQISECEMRALSTARVRLKGKLPLSNEAWDHQLAEVRHAWANPQPEEKAA
jgi:hypothetical protein